MTNVNHPSREATPSHRQRNNRSSTAPTSTNSSKMDTISSSTDGYVLRFVNEDLENQAFTLSKYYSGIIRNWVRGTPLLFAMKTSEGDALVGYAVVDKIENLWEMPPEEETYAREHGWKIALTLRGVTRFKAPLLIKNSALGSDLRRGAFLHGAKLTEHQIGTLLDQAEEAQEA